MADWGHEIFKVLFYLVLFFLVENNHIYKATILGEPMMGKRNLYPLLSQKHKKDQNIYDMMDILAYCDGDKDLLWIANKLNKSFIILLPSIKILLDNKLIKKVST